MVHLQQQPLPAPKPPAAAAGAPPGLGTLVPPLPPLPAPLPPLASWARAAAAGLHSRQARRSWLGCSLEVGCWVLAPLLLGPHRAAVGHVPAPLLLPLQLPVLPPASPPLLQWVLRPGAAAAVAWAAAAPPAATQRSRGAPAHAAPRHCPPARPSLPPALPCCCSLPAPSGAGHAVAVPAAALPQPQML